MPFYCICRLPYSSSLLTLDAKPVAQCLIHCKNTTCKSVLLGMKYRYLLPSTPSFTLIGRNRGLTRYCFGDSGLSSSYVTPHVVRATVSLNAAMLNTLSSMLCSPLDGRSLVSMAKICG